MGTMTKTSRHPRNGQVTGLPSNLPGADLIEAGIAALQRAERTVEALLVALAAERLRNVGLDVPDAADDIETPNLALYAAVRDLGGGHFEYNALLGRLASYAGAAEWLLREPARHLGRAAGV